MNFPINDSCTIGGRLPGKMLRPITEIIHDIPSLKWDIVYLGNRYELLRKFLKFLELPFSCIERGRACLEIFTPINR